MLSDSLCTHRHRSLTHAHTKNVQLKALTARLKATCQWGVGGGVRSSWAEIWPLSVDRSVPVGFKTVLFWSWRSTFFLSFCLFLLLPEFLRLWDSTSAPHIFLTTRHTPAHLSKRHSEAANSTVRGGSPFSPSPSLCLYPSIPSLLLRVSRLSCPYVVESDAWRMPHSSASPFGPFIH